MLEIIDGVKKYGSKIVLNNINYKFEDGKMYGITGANGSGKTLILKSLVGFIKYTTGKVMQDGNEIRKKNNYIENAGIIIENPVLVNDFTITQNLEYLRKQSNNSDNINLDKWYKFFNIEEYKDTKFKNLSLGTKQKIGLIQAFMHEPQNILLDEPFNALDKENVKIVQDYLVQKRNEGKLIIIITHINDDILNKCDKVLEISEGKILWYEKSSKKR